MAFFRVLRPQRLDRPAADAAAGRAQRQSAKLRHAGDGSARQMKGVPLVHMHQQRVQAGEVRFELTLDQFHDGQIRRRRISAVYQRQREDVAAGEAPRRVGCCGPNDIDHAVLRLVDQLIRFTAQCHRRMDLHPDAAIRFRLDSACPGCDQRGMGDRVLTQEVLQFQGDYFGIGAGHRQQQEQRQHSGNRLQCS